VSSRQTIDEYPREGELSSALRRNIETLRERRKTQKREASNEEKLADAITCFTGSMRFVTAASFRAWWN
jgi:uncharacterized membrane protein